MNFWQALKNNCLNVWKSLINSWWMKIMMLLSLPLFVPLSCYHHTFYLLFLPSFSPFIFCCCFCFVFHFSSHTSIFRGSAETAGIWVSQMQAVQNGTTNLEIEPSWLPPLWQNHKWGGWDPGGIRCYSTLKIKSTYQGMFVRCKRNFIIWKVFFFLGHISKLFQSIVRYQYMFSDVCIVTTKDTKTL